VISKRSLIALTLLVSHLGVAEAQTPEALAGAWDACFSTTSRPGTATCGTLTLIADQHSCGFAGRGSYGVPFDRMGIPDTTPTGVPQAPVPSVGSFVWSIQDSGQLRITESVRVLNDSVCEGTSSSSFEVTGRMVGDSVVGSWGWYGHYLGEFTLGSFVLKRRGSDP